MKVSALKLESLVAAHRKARGGDKPQYAARLTEAKAAWKRDKKRLQTEIHHYRAKLDEARKTYAQAKSEAAALVGLWERKLVEAAEEADPTLPRFTDEIKILSFTSSQEGASDSTIRIALGCATLQEARDIIQQGKDLYEGEQW